MMCEHELKQALLDIEFLQECNNAVNLALSVTRRELAAAKAELAELKAEKDDLQTSFNLFHASVEYLLSPGVLDRKGWIEGIVNVKDVSKKYREGVLDKMHRMEGALREIGEAKDASATWVQDIAKAALEEKP